MKELDVYLSDMLDEMAVLENTFFSDINHFIDKHANVDLDVNIIKNAMIVTKKYTLHPLVSESRAKLVNVYNQKCEQLGIKAI